MTPPDFLIVGMQKSGSYWLTALLDAHPSIRCFPSRPGHADGTGEAHLFDNLARLDDYPRFRKSMSAKLGRWFAEVVPPTPPPTAEGREALMQALCRRFDEFCDAQRREHRKPVVGEKTTETVHYPALVDHLYPGIRKVCILRDPRDRAVSFFFHQRRKGRLPDDAQPTPADLEAYVARVRADYDGLLALGPPTYVMTYERLSASPVDQVVALLEFLDVDATPDVAAAMVHAGAFESLSGRESGDADPSSHFRQGQVGDWTRYMDPQTSERMIAAVEEPTRRIEARFGIDLSGYRHTHAEARQ